MEEPNLAPKIVSYVMLSYIIVEMRHIDVLFRLEHKLKSIIQIEKKYKMKLATHNHPFGNTSLINWFFDDVLTKDTFNDNGTSHSVLSALNKPGMNIIEDKDNFNIELATPGLNKDDFKIDLKNGMIHVSAQ